MPADVYRGVVQNGTIVLEPSSQQLHNGTEVIVTPVEDHRGTAQFILAAVTASPVPSDWVDELESKIAEGRRPASKQNPFSESNKGS